MTIDWDWQAFYKEFEDALNDVSVDGSRVAKAINNRSGVIGRICLNNKRASSTSWLAKFTVGKLKMHDLGLKRQLYLGDDGIVYRRHIDNNGIPYFKRAVIERRDLNGIKRVHEAILRLAE